LSPPVNHLFKIQRPYARQRNALALAPQVLVSNGARIADRRGRSAGGTAAKRVLPSPCAKGWRSGEYRATPAAAHRQPRAATGGDSQEKIQCGPC